MIWLLWSQTWWWYILFIIIFTFVLLFFILLAVNRIKHPFWAIQPVFHYYDLHMWPFNYGIISPHLPTKNKYVNFTNINTLIIQHPEQIEKHIPLWKEMLQCIQKNYLKEHNCQYTPNLNELVPYFVGHNFPCFISTYIENKLQMDNNTISENTLVIGTMTSRPLYIYILINPTNIVQMPAYYVDFLCVDKTKRKQNVAPQIIQTHEYIQSHQCKKIAVSIFKREGELTGIVPLTTFHTHLFQIGSGSCEEGIITKEQMNATHLEDIFVVPVSQTNIQSFFHFIQSEKNNCSLWDIVVFPSLNNLIECVRTNNIFIYMCIDKRNENILGCYFFRNTRTFIDGRLILSCFASVRANEMDADDFVAGAQYAWRHLVATFCDDNKTKEKKNNIVGYISVENVSHNYLFIDNLFDDDAIVSSPTAFFFYNFAYSPFPAKRSLLIY